MKSFQRAPAAKSQLLRAKVVKCIRMAPAKVVCEVRSRSSSSRKCLHAKVACEARSRSSSSNIATSIFKRGRSSRISSSQIATCKRKSSMSSTLLQLSPAFLRSQPARRLTRERDMQDWAREVAQHHAREGQSRVAAVQHHARRRAQRHAQHHVQNHGSAASCATSRVE